jgi:hypothetical protein
MMQDGGHWRQLTQGRDLSRVALETLAIDAYRAGSTLLLRIYQEHFSSSQGIYGGLEPVATLLLWLYLTGAAILIGGEANSEIEKAASEAGHSDVRRPEERRSGGTVSDANVS